MRAAEPAGGFALLGVVSVLALLSLLAAWSLAAAPVAALRDVSREAMAVEARAAAESGLAMALHRLNAPQALDTFCEPDRRPGAPHWLMQHRNPDPAASAALAPPAAAGAFGPPPVMACAASHSVPAVPGRATTPATTWQCRCPGAASALAAATLSGLPATGTVQAAFAIGWYSVPDGPGRSVTRLESTGCVRPDGDCLRPPQPGEPPTVRRSVDLQRWPLLARSPAAALTAGGSIRLGPQTRIRNADPASGGRLLHAGGVIDRQGATLLGLPGAPVSDLAIQRDLGLAGLEPEAFQSSILGLPAARWREWPQVGRIDCPPAERACAAQVLSRQSEGLVALAVEGDLLLPPGFELGRPGEPVLLVVRGALHVQGPARIVGLAVADRLLLDGRSGPVRWEGAAASSGAIEAQGQVLMTREPGTVEALASRPAAVLPRAGSWRESWATAGRTASGDAP